jgi:hypothetical protein
MNLWNDNSTVELPDFVTPVNGNTLERISIAVQHGYVPFSLSSYVTSTSPTITASTLPTVSTTPSTSNPAHTVKTVLVEVHRRANFNLIGGAMVFRVPTSTYAIQVGTTPATIVNAAPTPVMSPTTVTSSTTPIFSYTFVYNGVCGGASSVAGTTVTSVVGTTGSTTPPAMPSVPPAAPSYSCVIQTQTGKTQLAGMAGINWFPWGRDYFPKRNGYAFRRQNLIPGVFAATSVTSLGNSAFGLNIEPVSGISLMIGAGMAHTTLLPSGVSTTVALPSGYTLQTITQVNWGIAYGIGLDLNVFSQIFSKGPSAASLP